MSRRYDIWWWVLVVVLCSRLFGMAFFPFVDTTEPRYAEIARLMAETGDWITPWFEPGVPFWGKPPLSFWAQAAAIKIFGLSEFSLRLPSWFATLAMVWLVWRLAMQFWNEGVARWSTLVFASMALTYISAGAVMTDSFLALGTTLSLVSFCLVMSGERGLWRWTFFVGAVIGLLSKGPLAIVLTGIPISLWLLVSRQEMAGLRKFPWWWGGLLTVSLTCPWYVLAELKTPGFLDYFLVGEHIRRFLDPGWAGDLYGSAHDQPKGMIWVFWLWASFPWGIIGLAGLTVGWTQGKVVNRIRQAFVDPATGLLLMGTLAPMLFFSVAGNTLWTYVLPSLPFAAILIGLWIAKLSMGWALKLRAALVGLVPILLTLFVGLAAAGLETLKTEKELVLYYQKARNQGDSPLLYLDDVPFSAQYYSRGAAQEITAEALVERQRHHDYQRLYLAIPQDASAQTVTSLPSPAIRLMENRRYQLLAIETPERSQPSLSDPRGVGRNDR